MIRLLALLILSPLIYINDISAQILSRRALPAAGGEGIISNYIFSYTLGETFSTTMLSGNLQLTLGMQQPSDYLTGINTIKDEMEQLTIYPNPSAGSITLAFNSPLYQEAILNIFDYTGRQIHLESFKINVGINQKKLDIIFSTSGLYYVQLKIGERIFQKPLVIIY